MIPKTALDYLRSKNTLEVTKPPSVAVGVRACDAVARHLDCVVPVPGVGSSVEHANVGAHTANHQFLRLEQFQPLG